MCSIASPSCRRTSSTRHVGGGVLRVRRRRGDRDGDAAAGVDRERAARGDHRERGSADAHRARRAARGPRDADRRTRGVGWLDDEARQGVAAVLAGLERDGLVTLTRPLKGTAAASRTVRVAALTAQGSEETTVKLGARQQQALRSAPRHAGRHRDRGPCRRGHPVRVGRKARAARARRHRATTGRARSLRDRDGPHRPRTGRMN